LRPSGSPRDAIRLLALAGFNTGISLRCVEPMLPKFAGEFGVSVAAAGVVITSFALAYAVAVLLQGPLGDRFGKLRVVTCATALAGLASLACGVAWSLESLALLRLATGMFASASIALGMAYIGDVVPLAERQATIAHFIAGSLLGQTLAPLAGGLLTDWVGWRATFAALGVIFLLVAAVLWSKTAGGWPAVAPGRFEPLAVHRALLRRSAVRWLVAVGIAETFFFFGGYAFLGAFLQQRFGLSFTAVGLILAGYGAGGLLYSSSARKLIRALGERGLVTAGGLLGLACYVAFTLLPHWSLAVPCTLLLGLAFYLVHNTIQTRATEAAPDARGSGVALYASAWALGQAGGVAAVGAGVAAAGYAPAILVSGFGFGAFGLWLRANLHRLRP
jgi:predicted MFS family arabinose efflux permease